MTSNTGETNTNALNQTLSRLLVVNREVVIFTIILLLAIFTRFHLLGDRVMSHDESLHTRFSYNLYNDGDFEHTPLMHGPILFHATAFMYAIFGDNDFSSRIYTSALGVLLVMSPWLFRRWLGRWGVILASIMLLISPLMLYYNRYIRHDTPSMLFAMLMMWAIMMYINGPPNQRRRAHWLYIIAASMVLNLGSKETAFIYIAIFGIFLAIYWFVRMAQYFWQVPGKVIFNFLMIGILLGGVLSMGMYIILDIIQFDLFPEVETAMFGALPVASQTTFFIWSLMAIATVMTVVIGTLFYAYRDRLEKIRWLDVAILVGVLLVVAGLLVVFEELSHTQPSTDEPLAPSVPGEGGDGETIAALSSISWLPMIATWAVSLAVIVFLGVVRRRDGGDEYPRKDKAGRGFWGTMDVFPEFDLIVVIGTLILPWATALIPYVMRGNATDYTMIAESLPPLVYNLIINIPEIGGPQQVGQTWVSFLAWLPLMVVSVLFGLAWNWRRWLVSAAIFYAIFAFFFTTVFTNIAGLGTGMIYSLGYWLEQQGVRRGSQPQYYYLLIIMPFYEFLPVIGGVLAMLAGTVKFWHWRRDLHDYEDDVSLYRSDDELLPEPDAPVTESASSVVTTDDTDEDAHTLPDTIRYQQLFELHEIPFLIFMSWLGVLNLVGYSLAGEKMPWLGTHLTLPLIFLTAWFFGRIIAKIDSRRFMSQGWLLLLVLPLLFITLAQVFVPLLIGRGPFSGLQQAQLQQTYSWLAAVGISGIVVFVVLRLTESVGFAHLRRMTAVTVFILLGGITFRSAWMASFINYDYATEFLVYAHAAPAIKTVLNDIEELSFRITDGDELKFAYDNSVSWPYSWYFRNYPNAVFVGENPTVKNLEDTVVVVVGDDKRSKVEPILEERYQRFDHIRLWWPMQDYFFLNPERVQNALDFSPGNAQAAAIREGIFDIWWSRDYTTYGNAVDKDYSIERWPVADTMHVYIRKDYARQIWEYGVGDGEVFAEEPETVNMCRTNWQDTRQAIQLINVPDQALNRPIGISLAPDGSLYVAEENDHHITTLGEAGNFARTIGQYGAATGTEDLLFQRPNSVSVMEDGNLIVVDTWNFRIVYMTPDGEVLAAWGQRGEYGFAAETVPVDAFWGPRDAAVDDMGNIFIADTGNKRVRVYAIEQGEVVHRYDIGSGGSGEGQLDEPVGLAVHPDDGRVFVADTWNRRISVFNREGGFITAYPVRAWYEEQGNRPYLAIDEDRNLLYVGDPDGGRVLVYTLDGLCVGAFGRLAGDTDIDASQFGIVGGIAVDDDGSVYVADSQLNRILKFEPFDDYELPVPEEDTDNVDNAGVIPESGDVSDDAGNGPVIQPETTDDVSDSAGDDINE